ncbi:hypothetical protein J120_00035 [candidate division TM6 bacterium JCVI TM6SC1]|uniref:Uncharacterized protein n=1 Tax=candidate division TM6 bacterium JCVI TM6SC1 TaxID=1306947 RepID=A0A0D2JE81_9BACT|nr:hypothetical protein J120_00035 [candidate division TM6 bacterium JCVI TM6SC1]
MPLSMDCNGKEILSIKTSVFSSVWHELYDMILNKEEPIYSHKVIKPFISQLYMCANDAGLDIADYLKTKNDTLLFADLFEEGIRRYRNELEGMIPDYFEIPLKNFVKEIRDYAFNIPEKK